MLILTKQILQIVQKIQCSKKPYKNVYVHTTAPGHGFNFQEMHTLIKKRSLKAL